MVAFRSFVHLGALVLLVFILFWIVETNPGKKISRVLPLPFWVYFVSIVLGTVGALPQKSPAYAWCGFHLLPAALVLLLIGTPVRSIARLGPSALGAVGLGMLSMLTGALISYAVFGRFLGEEGWKIAGTLLGTWTGGSANMLAVQSVLDLSENRFGSLVIVDTFLSYGWLAFLMMGVACQPRFDRDAIHFDVKAANSGEVSNEKRLNKRGIKNIAIVSFLGFLIGETAILLGWVANKGGAFLSVKAWAVLFASTGAVFLALTPLKQLEKRGASRLGLFFLYVVLASIGAKADLTRAVDAPWPFVFGGAMLLIHGIILVTIGKRLKYPLFLLATASQANVGGPISAPIVASVYRPGAAQMGVLMALVGAVCGTTVGVLGGWLCRAMRFVF